MARVEGGRVDLDAAATPVDFPVSPGASLQVYASGAAVAAWVDGAGVATGFWAPTGPDHTWPLLVPPTVRFLRLQSAGGAARSVQLVICDG